MLVSITMIKNVLYDVKMIFEADDSAVDFEITLVKILNIHVKIHIIVEPN